MPTIPVVTMAAAKGGVGKSTLAANLAYSLTQLGKRALVVDLDPQGSVTRFLSDTNQDAILNRLANLTTPEAIDTALNNLKQYAVNEDVSVLSLMDGKTVTPPLFHGIGLIGYAHRFNSRLGELEDEQTQERFRNAFLKVIEEFKPDVVILDTQPANNTIARNAITMGTHIVIPCEMTGEGLRGAVIADGFRQSYNRRLQTLGSNQKIDLAGVVPMAFNPGQTISTAALKLAKTRFGDLVTSPIDTANLIRVACSEGYPVAAYESKAKSMAPTYAMGAKRYHKSGRQFAQVAAEIGVRLGILDSAPAAPEYSQNANENAKE